MSFYSHYMFKRGSEIGNSLASLSSVASSFHSDNTVWLTLKWQGHFFQNVISFSDAVHLMCNILYMKLLQYNERLVSIVGTDGLVL